MHHNIIDTLIIIAYFSIMILYGLYQGKNVKTMKDFSVGNRKFSFFALTATIAASIIGGGTTLSNASIFYTIGIICLAGEICECIQLLITAKFIIPKMHLFKGAISIGDMMSQLFGKHGRIVAGACALIVSTGALGAQISALGFIFNEFLGFSHTTGALIGFSVLTFYSVFGGIKAVVATDMLQFIVLIIAIPIVGSYAIHACGGYEAIFTKLPKEHFSFFPSAKDALRFWPYYIGFMVPFTPTITQRMLLSDDTKKLKQSFIVAGSIKVPFAFAVMMIGFSAYILFPEAEPYNVVPSMIDFVLPTGLRGLAITGLLAIVMSTADSFLNTASICLVHDVVKPLTKNNKIPKELWATRAATFAISTGAILIAIYQKSIFTIVQNSYKYWLPLVSVPLILFVLGFKLNKRSFYASTLITSLFVFFYFNIEDFMGMPSHIPSAILSAFLYLIFNIGNRKPDTTRKQNTREHRKEPSFPRVRSFFKSMHEVAAKKGFIYTETGVLTIIYIIFFYFFIGIFSSSQNHTFYINIKIVAASLCLCLMIHELWRDSWKKALPAYWLFTLLFCLPFMSTLFFFSSKINTFNGLNLLFSAFILVFCVNWITAIILFPLGSALAVGVQHAFLGAVPGGQETIFILILITFLLSLICLTVIRGKENRDDEKTEAMYAICGTMAHELRTPLANMDILHDTLMQIKKSALEIPESQAKALNESLDIYKRNRRNASNFIDMTLVKLRGYSNDVSTEELSATTLIQKALDNFGLKAKEAQLIQTNLDQDFQFRGNAMLIQHVFYNLIKNSLYYIKKSGSGNIEISLNKDELIGTISLKDHGTGIAPEELEHVFEKFYSKRKHGTGLGLFFCKSVIESFKGSITCKSELGSYTEFIIQLPLSSTQVS